MSVEEGLRTSSDLLAEIDEFAQQCVLLQNDLEDERNRADSLAAQVEEVTESYERRTRQYEDAVDERNATQERVKELNAEASALRHERDSLAAQLENAEEALALVRAERDEAVRRLRMGETGP